MKLQRKFCTATIASKKLKRHNIDSGYIGSNSTKGGVLCFQKDSFAKNYRESKGKSLNNFLIYGNNKNN